MSVHRFAVFTAVATVALITAGGLVTSTGSGLAVPDWPLSYGTLFPPMVGGILYEHGHRLIAAAVAILTVALAVCLHRSEERRWVRRLGLAAVGAIAAQALLGGITVLFRLPVPVSVAHACLAQAVLGLTVTIAVVTSPSWIRASSRPAGSRPLRAVEGANPNGLRRLAVALTAAIYIQLILGALVRHTGSGLAIPDFPLALGRLIPPLASPGIVIHYVHRLGAVAVSILVVATVLRIVRDCRSQKALLIPGLILIPLLATQILLGAFTVWTGLGVVPATAHVATGAVLLATSLVVALMSHRLIELAPHEPTVAPLGVRAVTS